MDATTEITIRRAEVEDAEILTETCKRAYDSDSEVGAPGPGGPPGYNSLEWNLSRIKNQYLQYYVILKGNDIVGGFIVGDRGSGYQVCERIWALGTPEWNVRTNQFYQKIGFVQIGTTHEYSWSGIYYEKRESDGFPKAMSTIRELQRDQQRVVVEGFVEQISNPRIVTSRKTGEELKVADAVLSDDTDSIKLGLWNEHIRQVKANSSIRIEEGFVKDYRGELQLSIGQWGMIITLQ
ncbi:MAG: hypothetical protein ACXAEB_15120 [Candidatus Thorarchaeota archaeon]